MELNNYFFDDKLDLNYFTVVPDNFRLATIKDFSDINACMREAKPYLAFAKSLGKYYCRRINQNFTLTESFRNALLFDRIFVCKTVLTTAPVEKVGAPMGLYD